MNPNGEHRRVEVYNSVGGAAFFQRMLAEWRKAGWDVSLVQALTEEEYRRPTGILGKLARRWHMYGGYAWQCWRGARRPSTGSRLRVVTTNPFFAPSLVAATAGPGNRTVNLLYDLYPEALVQAGLVRPDSWVARRAAALTRHALRESAATVFLGERLRHYAEDTHGRARQGIVIPVGADGAPFRQATPQLLPATVRPQIMYAGQMGRMHDTITLLQLWLAQQETKVAWRFHASGSGYEALRRTAGARRDVAWDAPLAEAPWQAAMREAQVALVTIAAGAERVVMPSKTYSALVAGQAVLAICSRQSDLADLVLRHDCGWVVEPGDVDGLRAVVTRIGEDPAGLWEKRCRAFCAGHAYYDMQPVAAAWLKLFADLDEDGANDGGREVVP